MITLRRLTGVALLVGAATGCNGYGVLQTAHTVAPRNVSVAVGGAHVTNEISGEAGRGFWTNTGGELGVRAGVTRQVDVGGGPYMQLGAAADAKANLFQRERPHALALRLGGGFAAPGEHQLFMARAGVIGSYRLWDRLEPYVAATFANHWIRYLAEKPELAANEQLVDRRGYGDGLLQGALGLELSVTRHFGVLAEYGHWFPLQNDPGDRFKFLQTNVFAFALRFSS